MVFRKSSPGSNELNTCIIMEVYRNSLHPGIVSVAWIIYVACINLLKNRVQRFELEHETWEHETWEYETMNGEWQCTDYET